MSKILKSNLLFIGSLSLMASSIISAFYVGDVGVKQRPFTMVEIKWCPETANKNRVNEIESQLALDDKFCRNKTTMLKETFERLESESKYPLPRPAFQIKEIPASTPTKNWYLYSAILGGLSILTYGLKKSYDESIEYDLLEAEKSRIFSLGNPERRKRYILNEYDAMLSESERFSMGLETPETYEQKLLKQSEVQDLTHLMQIAELEMIASDLKAKTAKNKSEILKHEKSKSLPESTDKKAELIAKLKEVGGEFQPLWELIETVKPLWIYGGMGSGKSTIAAAIAFCRVHLLDHTLECIIDAHYGANCENAWLGLKPKNVACLGENFSYMPIGVYAEKLANLCLGRANKPLKENKKNILTGIFDEITNLSKVEEIAEPIGKLLRATNSDTRKAQFGFIGLAHGDTNETTGGVTGLSKTRGENSIKVHRYTNNKGETPMPNIDVIGLVGKDGKQVSITFDLPDWFQIPQLAKMLGVDID